MSDAGASRRFPLSYAEYVARERKSALKHQFVRGEIFAMAGGTRAHNVAAANVIRELGVALRETGCQVYTSDMRVRTQDGVGTYPDASVACGEPRFSDAIQDELLDPVVIVAVLSDSTEAYDRGEKFEHYQTIASLREYVLLDPRRVHVDVFSRESDGWKLRSYGSGATLALASVGALLSVEELYAKVIEEA